MEAEMISFTDPRTDSFDVLSKGVHETSLSAKTIAPFLRLGDLILLTGELAAGKTCFVKELAIATGCTDSVTSPTYTLAHFYNMTSGLLLHLDLYRVSGIKEWSDLGIEEYFQDAITVVEWGDKIASEFPEYLSVVFNFVRGDENHRTLTFSGCGNRWRPMIPRLKEKLSDVIS